MTPKYRGGEDDWLDSEKERGRNSQGKKKKQDRPKGQALKWEEANATVAEVFPKLCRVVTDDHREWLCAYRRAQVLGSLAAEDSAKRERSPVAVGDRVKAAQVSGSDGVIEGVCARRSKLSRPAPDRHEKVVHVVVANVDVLVIVAASQNPDFSPGLVDRFLIAAAREKIPAILCINKIDLCSSENPKGWELYERLGVPVVKLSARNGEGLSKLTQMILGKSAAFCGHSGVGKTSLLRALLGPEVARVGRVGDVNAATGKGKHTTTGAVLLGGPADSKWIDTPGIKEFGLEGITPENLREYFTEFESLECTQRGCMHEDGEPGCQAQSLQRHPSYVRILESLREEYA